MDESKKEREEGLDWDYLMDVPQRKEEIGTDYQTPGFGLAAQLFASVAKFVIDRLGPEEGEALLKEAVEYFGRERGRHIAERVKAMGKPLTLKNWLIYTDIDTANFQPVPSLEEGDLVARVSDCTFYEAAEEWGLGEYARIYCKYADYAILGEYNPDVKMTVSPRQVSGEDYCVFRYIMKEENE